MTFREWLDRGETLLNEGPHADRARADAETLLLRLLRKNKAWLLAHGGEGAPEELCGRYRDLLERRYRGEPIQYITGACEFYGLPFKVSRDVLIPRPETEHLVDKALSLAESFKTPRISDVGTGSGAIAVVLAHKLPAATITAIDLSRAALAVARENAERNGVDCRIRFHEGDLLASVAQERFDIVVSNPPYVPNTDRTMLSIEVREYEPSLALFAGDDGLDIYRRLIPAAFAALVPGGYIALEMGFSQAPEIQGLLSEAGFQNIELTADLQGIPRVASARRT